MPHLNSVSWKKFEKFLIFTGCVFERERGDHRIYSRADFKRPIVVVKEKSIPIFILRNNLRILGISTKEYLEILKNI